MSAARDTDIETH